MTMVARSTSQIRNNSGSERLENHNRMERRRSSVRRRVKTFELLWNSICKPVTVELKRLSAEDIVNLQNKLKCQPKKYSLTSETQKRGLRNKKQLKSPTEVKVERTNNTKAEIQNEISRNQVQRRKSFSYGSTPTTGMNVNKQRKVTGNTSASNNKAVVSEELQTFSEEKKNIRSSKRKRANSEETNLAVPQKKQALDCSDLIDHSSKEEGVTTQHTNLRNKVKNQKKRRVRSYRQRTRKQRKLKVLNTNKISTKHHANKKLSGEYTEGNNPKVILIKLESIGISTKGIVSATLVEEATKHFLESSTKKSQEVSTESPDFEEIDQAIETHTSPKELLSLTSTASASSIEENPAAPSPTLGKRRLQSRALKQHSKQQKEIDTDASTAKIILETNTCLDTTLSRDSAASYEEDAVTSKVPEATVEMNSLAESISIHPENCDTTSTPQKTVPSRETTPASEVVFRPLSRISARPPIRSSTRSPSVSFSRTTSTSSLIQPPDSSPSKLPVCTPRKSLHSSPHKPSIPSSTASETLPPSMSTETSSIIASTASSSSSSSSSLQTTYSRSRTPTSSPRRTPTASPRRTPVSTPRKTSPQKELARETLSPQRGLAKELISPNKGLTKETVSAAKALVRDSVSSQKGLRKDLTISENVSPSKSVTGDRYKAMDHSSSTKKDSVLDSLIDSGSELPIRIRDSSSSESEIGCNILDEETRNVTHATSDSIDTCEEEDSIRLVIEDDGSPDGSNTTPSSKTNLQKSRAKSIMPTISRDQFISPKTLKIDTRRSMAITRSSSIRKEIISGESSSTSKGTIVLEPLTSTTAEIEKSHEDFRQTPSAEYKCIVCDATFDTYSVLKYHLSGHTQKKNTAGTLSKDPPTISMKTNEIPHDKPFQGTGTPSSRDSKTTASPNSCSVTSNQKSLSSRTTTDVTKDVRATPSTSSKPDLRWIAIEEQLKKYIRIAPKKPENLSSVRSLNDTSKALQSSKSKDKSESQFKSESRATTKGELTSSSGKVLDNNAPKKSSDNVTKLSVEPEQQLEITTVTEKESHQDLPSIQNTSEDTSKQKKRIPNKGSKKSSDAGKKKQPKEAEKEKQPSKEVVRRKSKEDSMKSQESNVVDGNTCSKTGESTNEDVVRVTKPITICECHKKDITLGNYLRIEVALLCHTCRTVFRSMECFELHYRLPEYTICNKNRTTGRSPKLFCTNCGMIFSAIQDVRQHLELHARHNNSITTDFRCNVCKVAFIGIGSLFYVHWSNHLKNPFFLASRLSFPRNSLVNVESNSTKLNIRDILENYIYVAEHICKVCKVPFTTAEDLQKHTEECEKCSTIIAKKEPTIRYMCGICNHTFLNKSLLNQHTAQIHNQSMQPQYCCVHVNAFNSVFACAACRNVFDRLKDINKHWVKHSMQQEHYICLHCNKPYDSLDSFISHATNCMSETNKTPLLCKVIYCEKEFTCKTCKLGFETKEAWISHKADHDANLTDGQSSSSSKDSSTTSTSSTTSISVPNVTQQPEKSKTASSQKTDTQRDAKDASKQKEAHQSSSVINEESNKSVSNRQEDEDSEGELIIDCESAPAVQTQKNQQQQTTTVEQSVTSKERLPNREPETLQATATCETHNKKQNVVICELDVEKQSTSTKEASVEIVEKEGSITAQKGTGSTTDPVTPSPSGTNLQKTLVKEHCKNTTEDKPAEPRKGFLRVKTLAELSDHNKHNVCCAVCKLTFATSEELMKHSSLHEKLASNVNTVRPLTQNPATNFITQKHNKPTVIDISGPKHIIKVGGQVVRFNTFSQKEPFNRKSQPTWHIKEDAPSTSNSNQPQLAAYHKNLPACNIIRPPSGAISRPPIRKTQPIRPHTNLSNTTSVINRVDHQQKVVQLPLPTTVSERPATSGFQRGGQIQTESVPPMPQIQIPGRSVQPNRNQSGYSCNICPQFKGTTLSNYLLHKLSAEHIERKEKHMQQYQNIQNSAQERPSIKVQPITVQYQPLLNCGGVVTTATATTSALTTATNTGQYQQSMQQVYTPEVYSEPIIYVEQPTAGPVINYTIPSNLFVDSGNTTQNVATVNPQNLITVTNTGEIYHPVIFNSIAMTDNNIQNSRTYVCSFCPNNVSFVNEQLYQYHLSTHHPYLCSICGQNFTSTTELEIHKIKHEIVWEANAFQNGIMIHK